MEDYGTVYDSMIEEAVKFDKPSKYAIIMHNDDYTTMEFVVEILTDVFNKTSVEASKLMMLIHTKKMAIVGMYTFDIAMSKKKVVDLLAAENNYPLKIEIKKQ